MKHHFAYILFVIFALFAALIMAAWHDPASREPLAVPLAVLMLGACVLTLAWTAAGHGRR